MSLGQCQLRQNAVRKGGTGLTFNLYSRICNFLCAIYQSKIELEPRDKNGKTPLMLAKSHRHQDVVQVLQAEYKRRARCVPPLNEIWYVARKNTPCFSAFALISN
jgi:ankyrin repeat protein